MIRVLAILMAAATLARAEDGLYMADPSKAPKGSVQGNELVMRVPLRRMETPKAKRAVLFESAGSATGAYTIQIDLEESPREGWMPIVVLGDAVLVEEVGVSRSEPYGASLSFGTNDPKQATEFLARTAKIFGLTGDHVMDARKLRVDPASPTNGSQPIRAVTNRTSSAAGSRR